MNSANILWLNPPNLPFMHQAEKTDEEDKQER